MSADMCESCAYFYYDDEYEFPDEELVDPPYEDDDIVYDEEE